MALDKVAADAFLECVNSNKAARLVTTIEGRKQMIGASIGDHDRGKNLNPNSKIRAKVGIPAGGRGFAILANVYFFEPATNTMTAINGKLSDVGFAEMRMRDAKEILYNGSTADLETYIQQQYKLV